ncbi:MAG TPA: Gldg family protein, partial [Candidatus Melainabacteria bacterium]|nr:Gldg family protein [Candidatus Melainabacteria bacterium]
DTKRFWFYMTLKSGDETVQIPLPEDLSKGGLERAITAGLKRYSKGFLKTVGLVMPPPKQAMPQYGMPGSSKHFNILQQQLTEQYQVKPLNLQGGIPSDIDLLLLVSPEDLDDKQVFAIDQFLMQGGPVILSTSPYDIDMQKAL